MRKLSDTLARLKPQAVADRPSRRLESFEIEGANPGALRAWRSVHAVKQQNPALVVVLHGCSQTAAAYDVGSGWSAVAERHGFVVLYPEQQRQNNQGLCFNWFAPEDTRRDVGEAASIRSAIETTIRSHNIDPSRVFVTGLSAGGAMAAVMLATYPELFAGGAVFAGLPYGSARSVPEALDRMRGHGLPLGPSATATVLTASGHTGPWPAVSIWHGDADHTVVQANADVLVAQWAGVNDLPILPDEVRREGCQTHRIWRDHSGRVVLEDHRITGMGHGVPLATTDDDGAGVVGPYMLEVGVSSTRQLIATWGLDDDATTVATVRPRGSTALRVKEGAPFTEASAGSHPGSLGVRRVIEDALRRAGLMSGRAACRLPATLAISWSDLATQPAQRSTDKCPFMTQRRSSECPLSAARRGQPNGSSSSSALKISETLALVIFSRTVVQSSEASRVRRGAIAAYSP